MKCVASALSCTFLLLCAGSLYADAPELEAGVYLNNGPQLLEVNGCAVPFVTDWNNDGRKDLLVGQFINGNIWLFLNQGTDMNPVFNGGSMVQSSGVPISVSYG